MNSHIETHKYAYAYAYAKRTNADKNHLHCSAFNNPNPVCRALMPIPLDYQGSTGCSWLILMFLFIILRALLPRGNKYKL